MLWLRVISLIVDGARAARGRTAHQWKQMRVSPRYAITARDNRCGVGRLSLRRYLTLQFYTFLVTIIPSPVPENEDT